MLKVYVIIDGLPRATASSPQECLNLDPVLSYRLSGTQGRERPLLPPSRSRCPLYLPSEPLHQMVTRWAVQAPDTDPRVALEARPPRWAGLALLGAQGGACSERLSWTWVGPAALGGPWLAHTHACLHRCPPFFLLPPGTPGIGCRGPRLGQPCLIQVYFQTPCFQ